MLEQEVKELIIDVLQLEDMAPADIDSEAPLFVEGLGLDSIDALEIGVALQKRYGITLPAESPGAHQFLCFLRFQCDIRVGEVAIMATRKDMPDIGAPVPHGGPMSLPGRLVAADAETLCAELAIGPRHAVLRRPRSRRLARGRVHGAGSGGARGLLRAVARRAGQAGLPARHAQLLVQRAGFRGRHGIAGACPAGPPG